MKFMISEKFRLDIRWEEVKYKTEGVAIIKNCYLCGPVLKEVVQLNEKDHISLDFVNQYVILVKNFYIATLYWEGIKYSLDKIFLNKARLENRNINAVPNLKKDDYIAVDTKDHNEENHMYHLTYPAYVLKVDGSLYNFGENR